MYFCILTWAAKSVNATTPDPVSGVWRQASLNGVFAVVEDEQVTEEADMLMWI